MHYKAEPVPQYKYLNFMAMLSITMMIISMLFTYRVIQIGPLTAPGGVFIFALTYTVADIITEVYGLRTVLQVIKAMLACIIVFNLLCDYLIRLPVPEHAQYLEAYNLVFSHNISLLIGFGISFFISDNINARAINKWKILLKGRHFWLRSIGSSAIGETLFGIFAAILMYTNMLSFGDLLKVISSTWLIKIAISVLASYPATVIVEFLKKSEGVKSIDDLEFKELLL